MNLTDTIQHWLQGQINDAVAGHSSRIGYLEGYISSLSERLEKLEKAYPDMATTNDLLKATNPSVLADKVHEYIEQVVDGKLDGYARQCDLKEDVTAILDGRNSPCNSDKLDAQRYRWLRGQHWSDNVIAVVGKPKTTVLVGTECYSGDRLDTFVDERLQK